MATPQGPDAIGGGPGPVSIGAAISWSFAVFRRNPTSLILLAAVVAVIQMVQQVATGPLQNILTDCSNPVTPGQQAACQAALGSGAMLAILTAIGFGILAMVAMIGVYHAALRATSGQVPRFADLYTSQFTLQFVLVTLASMGLTLVGVLLCCLPGLAALFFLQLAPFSALDGAPGVRASLVRSARSIRANLAPALLLLLLTVLVSLLGSAFYGVLTLLTLPFVALVTAHVYRQFNGQPVAAP